MSKAIKTIGLEGVQFKANIGLYPEEKIIGNNFLVDFEVAYKSSKPQETENLLETINYADLYIILENEFKKNYDLIETVAQTVLNNTLLKFPYLKSIKIKIKKLNPPIQAQINHAFVALNYHK
ncbi:MAG: dihydroneopterin aldolase [Sphingobacteriales bacterium]|nr:MAG: dihydroneopterin aldolase [Sphingobacteriales bacterium]TAF83826.1 MAG: dihydroneopterin aldolase [Sphingobacteriales bacterium]